MWALSSLVSLQLHFVHTHPTPVPYSCATKSSTSYHSVSESVTGVEDPPNALSYWEMSGRCHLLSGTLYLWNCRYLSLIGFGWVDQHVNIHEQILACIFSFSAFDTIYLIIFTHRSLPTTRIPTHPCVYKTNLRKELRNPWICNTELLWKFWNVCRLNP